LGVVAVDDDRKRQDELSERIASGKVRQLIADDLRWEVREVLAPPFDRRGGTHLMFDGEIIMRRVRFFPPDWHSLSDEELYALTTQIRRDE
jgi:hypothetical protein